MLSKEQGKRNVIDYFLKRESRWGYTLLLRGIKHFGYYPPGQENISMVRAQRFMMAKVCEALDLQKDSLVLDAGCGEGATSLWMARYGSLRVHGVDLLDTSIKKAKRRASRIGLPDGRVRFSVMDYSELYFPDETFDGVFTLETLVHAYDFRKTLAEFHRVLKKGGRIALFEYSIPPVDAVALSEGQKRMAELIVRKSAMHSLPSFTHDSFPKILTEVGFDNISTQDVTSRILPMLKRFYQLAYVPYQIIRALGLEERFVNTTAGYECYKNVRKNPAYFRYNIVTANKK